MKTKLFVAGIAVALTCGASAAAQPAASSQPKAGQALPPSAVGAVFTDDQLKSFAAVALLLQKNPAQDQAAQVKAIQDSGLTVTQYNEIATRMRTDPALTAKIQQYARASQAPSSTELPTSGAEPGRAPANDAAPGAAATDAR